MLDRNLSPTISPRRSAVLRFFLAPRRVASIAIAPIAIASTALMSCQRADATGPRLATRQPPPAIAAREGAWAPASAATDTVLVLHRLVPLAHDLTVSRRIGPDGGELTLAAAGASLRIPRGALQAPLVITMTAKAGTGVAYEFEPHGTKFPVALVFRQNLGHTQAVQSKALAQSLHGSYFDGDLATAFVDPARLFVRVREQRPTSVDDEGREVTFTIAHFSGYLLSSGRAHDLDEE